MLDRRAFYIDGSWIVPEGRDAAHIVNPSTEQPFAVISMGTQVDVDAAVTAAERAFKSFGRTSKSERLQLLGRLLAAMERRVDDFADAISQQIGAPITLARETHTKAVGINRLKEAIAALERFPEEGETTHSGRTKLFRQPIGVCGLITPWNWPINQVAQKLFPALAVGCSVVLKPSTLSPLDSMILAECIDEAGYPKGVFNLINGSGTLIGDALARHPSVRMVSLTGSTRAGVSLMKSAADTVKRVALELGGKSPNIVFDDADVDAAVDWGVRRVMTNSGQTCTAPTRMLVQRGVYDQAVDAAKRVCDSIKVGNPSEEGGHIGPVVSAAQYDAIQNYIALGTAEGARLIAGGLGRPEPFNCGFYVRPTVFADVDNKMTIAQEEIFGPVLVIIPFKDEAEAVAIANDSPYGLAGYIQTADPAKAERVAMALEAGVISINSQVQGVEAPFGGTKLSGNGREGSTWGLEEYTELKSVTGL